MALIAAALVFAGSLGLSTDLYDAFSKTILDPDHDLDTTAVTGSRVYYDMFGFNSAFTKAAVGLIIVSLSLFVTRTHIRRKYYISNYISTALVTAAYFGISIWCLPQIMHYKSRFQNEVDFGELKAFSKDWGTLYISPDDTFWFDMNYFVFGFLILSGVLLIVNVFLKIKVMRAERQAIGSGKERA